MTKEIEELTKKVNKIYRKQLREAARPISLEKAAEYLGISKSHLQKLTSNVIITHYKPGGKVIYFKKRDLDRYAFSKKKESASDIERKAKRRRK